MASGQKYTVLSLGNISGDAPLVPVETFFSWGSVI